MKKIILLPLLLLTVVSLYATPLFTPTIDGIKEAGWGSTPDASSANYASISSVLADGFHSQNAAQDIYITDDPNYLYIGYYYNGDAVNGYPSSRLNFGIITNSAGNTGGTSDPWESHVTYGSGNHPDFLLRQWTESQSDERMEFGPALGYSSETKGVAEFLNWSGSSWVGAGSVIHYERLTSSGSANNWGEIAIPLSTLGVETGDSIKVFYYYRPSDSCQGYSDSTPWDPNASADGSTAASINSNVSYTIRSDNVKPTISGNSPAHTSTGQSRSTDISFDVSDNIAFSSTNINVTVGGNDAILHGVFQSGYQGSITTNSTSSYSVTINPDEDFNFSQKVTVGISVSDATGNVSQNDLYFYVEDDLTAPSYSSITPADGSQNVSKNTLISFTVEDSDRVVLSTLSIWVNGIIAYTNSSFQSGFSGINSSVVPTLHGYQVTLDPDPNFGFGQSVQVQAKASDRHPNVASLSFSFTNENDTLAPTLSDWSPLNNAINVARDSSVTFSINDNDDIHGLSTNNIHWILNGQEVFYTNWQGSYNGSVTPSGNGFILTLNTHGDFEYAEKITNIIQAVDFYNNVVSTTNIFTVIGDTVSPSISGVSPTDAATGVSKSTAVTFTLSDNHALNLSSLAVKINGQNAILSGVALNGYSYSATTNGNGLTNVQINLTHSSAYPYSQNISVQISVEDEFANLSSKSTSFTVESDNISPFVTFDAPVLTNAAPDSYLEFTLGDDFELNLSGLVVDVNGVPAIIGTSFQNGFNGSFSQLIQNNTTNSSLRIDPENNFNYEQVVHILVTNIDWANNTTVTQLSVLIQTDAVLPQFSSPFPSDTQTGVERNSEVFFNLSDNVEISLNKTIWWQNDTLIFTNGTWQAGYSGMVITNSGTLKLDLTNHPLYDYGTRISNFVFFADYRDNNRTITNYFDVRSDETPPNISVITPTNNQNGVTRDQIVRIGISDGTSIDWNTLNIKVNGTYAIQNGLAQSPYAFATITNGNASPLTNVELQLSNESLFDYGATINLQISVKDMDRNYASLNSAFSVQSDSVLPTITLISPYANSTNSRDTDVVFRVADDFGVNLTALNVWINNTHAISGGTFLSGFNGALSGIQSLGSGIYEVRIDPNPSFNYENDIHVVITNKDTSDNTATASLDFGIQADNVSPEVLSAQPANDAFAVSRNAQLQITFQDNIDLNTNTLSWIVDNITVFQNGIFTTGNLGIINWSGTNRLTLQLTNHALFDYASVVTQKLVIADSHANQLSWTNIFNIKQDDVSPVISSFSLNSNSQLVERGSALTFRIQDDHSVNFDKLTVKVNGNDSVKNGIPVGTYSYSILTNTSTDFSITLTNTSLYSYEEKISVAVSVEDADRNYGSTSTSYTIRQDFVPPIVSLQSPINGSVTNHKDSPIQFEISDDNQLNINSLEIDCGTNVVLQNTTFTSNYFGLYSSLSKIDNATYQVTVDPLKDFEYNQNVEFTVRVQDAKGNALTNHYSFAISPDYTPPHLVSTYPSDQESRVDYKTNLIFEFSDDLALDLSTLSVRVAEEGKTPVIAYSNSVFNDLYHGNLSGLETLTNGIYKLTLDRTNDFPLSNNVSLNFRIADTNGNFLDQTLDFTTAVGDISSPQISYMTPHTTNVEPDTLLSFVTGDDSGIDISTLNVKIIQGTTTNTAIENGQFKNGYLGASSSRKTNALGGYDITIDPETVFPYSTAIQVLIEVQDTSGNQNIAQDWSFTVRPPDTQAPTISAINPLTNATDIGIDTTISFEIKDNYSVPSNWVELQIGSDIALTNGKFQAGFNGSASSLRANASGGWLVTVKPNLPLAFNQWIEVKVSARDSSTNSTSYTYRFKTYDSKIAVPIRTSVNLKEHPEQSIQVKLNRFGNLRATIYNLQGQKIGEIPERFYNLGEVMEWVPDLGGSIVPGSGVYFLQIQGEDVSYTMKVVIIK